MYTKGCEQLVHGTRGLIRSGRVVYPARLDASTARRSAAEPAREWLQRCVEALGAVEPLETEPNLTLIMSLRADSERLLYANLQVLWTSAPLRLFLRADARAGGAEGQVHPSHQYLRLDYDPDGALGPLLKEPQPHVHVEAEGEPRFPIPVADQDDPIGWFLDFVYRNFYYDDWCLWAELAWDDWCREAGRVNRWSRLEQAFAQSKPGVIEADPALKDDLLQLKRCLRVEQRKLFPLAVDATRADLFG